ncbi:MAG TPA: YtxH domain-containing protein [Candidatus Angelobacter sp.]|nr:YtxH domain-containing protein [Candidatus Angelobacter sp.]
MNEYAKYGDYTEQSFAQTSAHNTRTAITWLLAGIGIGAAVTALFTPRSGREVRENIAEGFRNTVSGMNQRTRELRDRGTNLLRFGRRGAREKAV